MKKILKTIFQPILFCSYFISIHANGTDFSYSLFSELSKSDNLTTAVNGVEGSFLTVGGTTDIETSFFSSWFLDLSASYSYGDYSIDELSNEKRKTLTTTLEYRPTTNNMSLLMLQNLSQVPQNRFSNADANNIRDVTISSIQPSYFIQVSPSNIINFQATLTSLDNGSAQDTVNFIDGSRDTTEYIVGYERQINALNFFSVIANKQETLFDAGVFSGAIDFSQDDLFFRWSYQGNTTNLQVDLGRSRVTFSGSNESVESDLYAVLFSRRLNRSHNIVFTSSKGFNNQFRQNLDGVTNPPDDDLSDFNQAIAVNATSISYTAIGTSFDVSLNSNYTRIEGTASRGAETRRGLSLGVIYYLSRAFNSTLDSNLTFSYATSRNSFDASLTNVNENEVELYGLTYNYAYSRSISFYGRLNRRDTFQNELSSGKSDTISIGFTYRPSVHHF